VLANEILSQTNGWGHMNGWGGGWMWLWGVAMMTLFVLLIVRLIRAPGADPSGAAGPARREPNDQAREILGERFAEGELSPEEYRERVSELQGPQQRRRTLHRPDDT
jgi:putative membrane protein